MSQSSRQTRRTLRATLAADRANSSLKDLGDYLDEFDDLEVDEVVGTWFAIRDGLGNEAAGVWDQDGDTFGPYQVIEEIGRGAQATVHRAIDLRLGRDVALRVLSHPTQPGSTRLVRRFEREARLASRLDHAGICTVYDVGVSGERPYIAMQLLSGQTLESELEAGPIDPRRVVRFGAEIARALAHAHEQGVIHRDVKPSNIAINDAGHPVLMDFGIARPVAMEEDQPLTRAGELFGTPGYMSPEQVSEASIRLDGRTDVWSLAVTLYESLTGGRLPFEGPTHRELFHDIRTQVPADPPAPKDLVFVLRAAMTKERERRYATAADFAADLERILDHRPVRVRSRNPVLWVARWVQRNPALTLAVALTTLAVAIAVMSVAGG